MLILVINSGSSSLKYQVRDTETEEVLTSDLIERIGISEIKDHGQSLDIVAASIEEVLGGGHRSFKF
jgi:acetate kinase